MMSRFSLWCRGAGWLAALVLSGCGENFSSSSPIFFEFKQQPGDKYVYKIADEVQWAIVDSAGKVFDTHHVQEQKSVMKFLSIDSLAVRAIDLSFIITYDSILSTTDTVRLKKRKSRVGQKSDLHLRMNPNGRIVAVTSTNPKLTFFYETGYRPSQPAFPEHAIARGYSWTQNFIVNVPGGEPGKVAAEYQFTDFERIGEFDCAVIAFKSELHYVEAYKPKEACVGIADCIGQYDSRTTSVGKLYFAYREGMVVKKENLITTISTMAVKSGDKSAKLSDSEFRDQEKITLVAIYRNSGEKTTFEIE
ncbi:MAG: hypothetical protein AAB354_06490 [candidate division KSB1 bacterium]